MFDTGDRVICVKASKNYFGSVAYGEVYTVRSAWKSGDFVTVDVKGPTGESARSSIDNFVRLTPLSVMKARLESL